ncbi:MAG: hypothetical protein AAF730_15710 [Bacteroidota bacterium]
MIQLLRKTIRKGWRPNGLFRLKTAAGPVRYRIVQAEPGKRPTLVVGLHGFGSDERQVETMLALDLPGPVVYLAPRGPLSEGRGFSWFELLASPDGVPVPPGGAMAHALEHLSAFTYAAQRAWSTDPARTVLVGYSQGGALALAASQRAARPFTAVATLAVGIGQLAPPRTPLFLGYGTLDPFTQPETVRQRLAEWAGANVTASEVAAPHVVTAQHRADLNAWLRGRLQE